MNVQDVAIVAALSAVTFSLVGAQANADNEEVSIESIEQAFGVTLDDSGPSLSPQQRNALTYLGGFPPAAQQAIMQMTMQLAQDPKLDILSIVKIYNTQGAEAAFQKFPQATQKAIEALGKQLEADPSVNNPQAMQNLLKLMMVLQPKGATAPSR